MNNTKISTKATYETSRPPEKAPELLHLQEAEVTAMEDISEIIGDNPRAIKRFVNIFRIIKAHGELQDGLQNLTIELPVILFMIALPLGTYKSLLTPLEDYITVNTDGKIFKFPQFIR